MIALRDSGRALLGSRALIWLAGSATLFTLGFGPVRSFGITGGFDVNSKGTGAGFVNMSDRVGAIGGSLRVESTPGEGTRISGMVPIGG